MKTITRFFVMLCLFIRVTAQSYSTQVGVMSEYLGSVGATFYDGPILVSQFDVGYKSWYFGILVNTGLSGTPYGKTYGDDWNGYFGWVHEFGPIKADISASYYGIAELGTMKDDIWVAEVELSAPKCPFVQPYIRGRYFGEVGPDSPESGPFMYAGVRKSIAFERCTLNLQLSTAYAGGAFGGATGFVYGRLTTSLDIPLSKRFTLTPSVIYQIATPDSDRDPKGFAHGSKFVFGGKIKMEF